MVSFFPKQISQRAIIVYLVSLIVVSLYFSDNVMSWTYMLLGGIFVIGFFSLLSYWTPRWRGISARQFIQSLFILAIILRVFWVVFSYFAYIKATGIPFEYGAADSLGYHDEASWLAGERWKVIVNYYFGSGSEGISDVGYPLYLTILYKIFGTGVILPRVLKSLLSAWTCVLVYKLASRTFNESTGRMAGLMCALMPNLIIYCGLHLKETEMVFLEVAFLERLDYAIRERRFNLWSITVPTLIAGIMFFFRTILGAAAVFTFISAVLLSSIPTMKKGWKRTALAGWGVLCLALFSGGTAVNEVETLWEDRDENASLRRLEQTSRGNQWAKYATGAVMAPMAFVLPYATMVDVDEQYGQQEKHGGNFIRNFMGFFVFIAIVESFRRKEWRQFVIVGAFVVAYLGVVALSGFSNSERFLLPGLPCLIMMWSYGVSTLRAQSYRWINFWCIIVFFMEIGWAFFKLGSRGLF